MISSRLCREQLCRLTLPIGGNIETNPISVRPRFFQLDLIWGKDFKSRIAHYKCHREGEREAGFVRIIIATDSRIRSFQVFVVLARPWIFDTKLLQDQDLGAVVQEPTYKLSRNASMIRFREMQYDAHTNPKSLIMVF
jgi:hypothetical protein